MDNKEDKINFQEGSIEPSLIKIHNCEHFYNLSLMCVQENPYDKKIKLCNVIL